MINTPQKAAASRWGVLVSRDELRVAQGTDGLCRRVSEWLEARTVHTDTASGQTYDSYLMSEDGILLRYIPCADDDNDETPFRTVIPWKLRKTFLRCFHDSALGGHSSSNKTYDKLCRVVTWPGMRQDCLRFVQSCRVCQCAKPRGGQPPGSLQPIVSPSPWQIAACDVMGPFSRSPRGN